MSPDLIYANGIDASSGRYLLPPIAPTDLATALRGEHPPALTRRAAMFGVDPLDLAEAGWAVVLPRSWQADGRRDRVLEALGPLLARRRSLAGRTVAGRYRVLEYVEGEDKPEFLARHGVDLTPPDPDLLPYYLLLVGSPEEIPYRLQFGLDVEYAVGRLDLEDDEAFARYSATVVAAEEGRLVRPQRASFFAAETPGDVVTDAMARFLVEPVADDLENRASGWEVRRTGGRAATKQNLLAALREDPPALLFTTSHGVGFAAGHPLQRDGQGALLCSDWPGLESGTAVEPRHYLAAADLDAESPVAHGSLVFLLACHSAGTPAENAFPFRSELAARPPAPEPFVARLAQRLLGHPSGGALAVVGHVAQAWLYGFLGLSGGRHPQVFTSALRALLAGAPAGFALESFGQRHGSLSAELADRLHREQVGGEKLPDDERVRLWTALADARGYVLLGDPAVRLATADHPNR